MSNAELPADLENKELAAAIAKFFQIDIDAAPFLDTANLIRVMSHQIRANLTYGVREFDEADNRFVRRGPSSESPKNALLHLRAIARRSGKSGNWQEFVTAWASVSSVVQKSIWDSAPDTWHILQQKNPEIFISYISASNSFIVPRPEIAITWIGGALSSIRKGRDVQRSRSDLDELILFLVAVYRSITGDYTSRRDADGSYISGRLHDFISTISACVDIGIDKNGERRVLIGANDERRLRRIIREIRIGGRLCGAYAKQRSIVCGLQVRFKNSQNRQLD